MSSSFAITPLTLSARAATRSQNVASIARPWLAAKAFTQSATSQACRRGDSAAFASSMIYQPSSPLIPTGHAPHESASFNSAGPSRCFCSSSHQPKSSATAPGPALGLGLYDTPYYPTQSYFYQDEDQHSLDQVQKTAARPPNGHVQLQHSTSQPSQPSTFFTPASPSSTTTAKGKQKEAPEAPLWTETLSPEDLGAILDRAHVLLWSGERSLPALARQSSPNSTKEQLAELEMILLRNCKTHNIDPLLIRDLHQSSLSSTPGDAAPRTIPASLFKLRRSTLNSCYMQLFEAELLRDAAVLASDPNLKPSQARFMVEKILFCKNLTGVDFRPLKQLAADAQRVPARNVMERRVARATLRETVSTMCNLLADGVQFDKQPLQRAIKLLCQSHSYGLLLKFARLAQRRAQLDNIEPGLRVAGGFSRLRSEQELPPFTSLAAMESAIKMLCSHDSQGAKTAYELMQILPMAQRSGKMYDDLMKRFANVSASVVKLKRDEAKGIWTAADEVPNGVGASIDVQLWRELCSHPHLGGLTLATFSNRILCHAAYLREEMIRADLTFLSRHEMGEPSVASRLAAISCFAERGNLEYGFKLASMLLSSTSGDTDRIRTRTFNALLSGAINLRIWTRRRISNTAQGFPTSQRSTRTRTDRLRSFIQRLQKLQNCYPFQPDKLTLTLLIRVLMQWHTFVDLDKMWLMVEMVLRTADPKGESLKPVMKTFALSFEKRGDTASAERIEKILLRLDQKE